MSHQKLHDFPSTLEKGLAGVGERSTLPSESWQIPASDERPPRMPAVLFVGAIITVRSVAADGTLDPIKPAKKWRVNSVPLNGVDVLLQPLNDDGTVDEFKDAVGDFRIRVDPVV